MLTLIKTLQSLTHSVRLYWFLVPCSIKGMENGGAGGGAEWGGGGRVYDVKLLLSVLDHCLRIYFVLMN